MRIATVGKGGAGKTTIAGTLARILAKKEIMTGCTVHLVNEKLDGGKIIAQKSFYIMLNSNALDLKKRTQNLEYSAYPEALIKIFRSSY